MTGRGGSTRRVFMKVARLPAHRYSIFACRRTRQWRVQNYDGRTARLCPKSCWRRESSHPHDLITGYDYRPCLALDMVQTMLLQQFLDLFWGLRMGRPESISWTPVPNPYWSR